jgi:hypothetical protein
MLKNIITGVVIGLVTLWVWDRWQRAQGDEEIGGGTIIGKVRRLFNTPSREFSMFESSTGSTPAGNIDSGGCGCS